MRIATMLSILVLTMTAPAYAQLGLSWNDCASGDVDHRFACDNNTALHYLVPSFVAPAGIDRFVGATTEIIVAFNTTGVPAWWQLYFGGCRPGRLSVAGVEGPIGCADPYEGASCVPPQEMSSACLVLINFEPNYGGNPARARITVDNARLDMGAPLTAGLEYMSIILVIRSGLTTGDDTCAGCQEPVCLNLQRITLGEPTRSIDVLGSACVTWQGGGIDDPSGCCGPVPTRRETWGGVKSLYR